MSYFDLSAVVITLDEKRNIPGLLDALDWVDEVILVDGGSRDRTVEIARRTSARVSVRPFDNFAAQRNYATSLARGIWILSIDADERPGSGFATEVRRRISNGSSSERETAAWRVPIRSKIFGRAFRYCGTQNDRPIRLFRRANAHWCGDVHERLVVEGPVGELDAHLEHETIPDLSAFLEKMHRYTSLDAEAAVASGIPPCAHRTWTAPLYEIARRLLVKHGWLDGPEGWAFCALSGLSAWVAADKHRQLWQQADWTVRRANTISQLRPIAHG